MWKHSQCLFSQETGCVIILEGQGRHEKNNDGGLEMIGKIWNLGNTSKEYSVFTLLNM